MSRGRPVAAEQPSSVLETVRVGSLVLITVCFFCPFAVERVFSPSLVLVGALWLFVTARLVARRTASVVLGVWIPLPVLGLIAAYVLNTQPAVVQAQLGSGPALATQYLLVLPVACVAGAVCVRDPGLRTFLRIFTGAAVVNALLATAERLTGRPVFPANTVATSFSTTGGSVATALTDDGAVRGIVASEHPLVLGVLLLAAVPMAHRALGTRLAVVASAVLVVGIWATDSSGPLLIAAVAMLVWPLTSRIRPGGTPGLRRTAMGGYLLLVVGFVVAASTVWRPVIDTFSSVSESTQYRFALYSLLPGLVALRPFGFGLGSVPSGTILIERTGRPLDASVSVDSELVLLVIQAGVIGAVVFAAVLGLAIDVAVRRISALGAPLLVVTVSGMFLALHVWPSAGALWAFLIGAAIAAQRPQRTAPPADAARTAEPVAQVVHA